MSKAAKYWERPPGFYLSRHTYDGRVGEIEIVYLTGGKSGVQYVRRSWDTGGWDDSTTGPSFTWLNWNCVFQDNVEDTENSKVEFYPTFEELQAAYRDDPVIGRMIKTPPKPPPKKKTVQPKLGPAPANPKGKISSQDCVNYAIANVRELQGVAFDAKKPWTRTDKWKIDGGVARTFQLFPASSRIDGYLGYYDLIVLERKGMGLDAGVKVRRFNERGVEVDKNGVPVPKGMQPA